MGSTKHAVVIGSSMGGMLAARVLSDHYERVTLLERDPLPETCENRRGVPQGRHTHGLLASGREVLEKLFPGFSNELATAGAVRVDPILKGRWFQEGDRLVQFPSGLEGFLMSRPLLEGLVRRRIRQTPRINLCPNAHVDDLEWTSDHARVAGVRVGGEVIEADLVVEATGRGSHSPAWLEAAGYEKPVEERVEVGIAYTTRLFRRRPTHLGGDALAVVPPTVEGKCCGVLLAQEEDRWTVTLVGYFGRSAPSDLPGFIAFAKGLASPDIYDVVSDAEPIGDAVTARFPASQRRRYENLRRFPQGYLVFGDAICSFNPIYGQGMSTSALEAIELGKAVAEGPTGLAQRFFQRAAKVVDMPWSVAVGADLRMPETVGPRNTQVNVINWYMARLSRAGHHDPAVAMAFHRVANLMAPPPSVLSPKTALRVLWGNLFRTRSRPGSQTASYQTPGKSPESSQYSGDSPRAQSS